MADLPIPISDISDPAQIRVKLLASNKDVHAPLSAVGVALNTIYNWATVTHAATEKTTPADADEFSLVDSAASNVIKKITWANIKATLKTYFDTLYQPLAATLTSWAAITRAAGFDTFTATPSSANLRSLLTDETGTGAAVFAGAPTLTGVPVFSGIPLLSGGAVSFPATQVPSAGANDLDDFEKGSWTPALTFGGGSTGITYTTRQGRYTKIGNKVTIWAYIKLSAKGSSTGFASVTGAPFTALSNVTFYGGGMPYFGNTTSVVSAGCAIPAGGSSVTLYNLPNGIWADTNFQNTTELVISLSYEAT